MQSVGADAFNGGSPPQEESDVPSGNDLNILQAMGLEFDTENLAFQGIRRKLGLHQETLSRALHRLERDGFVEKRGQSYRLSNKGQALVLVNESGRSNFKRESARRTIPILAAILPQDLDLKGLVGSLEHRWFGNLRWLGSSGFEDSIELNWISQDGSLKLTARIENESIIIESDASRSGLKPDAVRDGYLLFDHIMKTLREIDGLTTKVNEGRAS